MLDFDNTAFYYFALTLCFFYLVPTVWFLLTEVYGACGLERDATMVARTEVEVGKVARVKAKRTGLARLQTSSVLWSVVGSVVVIFFVHTLLVWVGENSEMAAFDPFLILGVEPGTEDKLIKKAYRKLSLKYHPDKNVGDKVAEEMFMKLAKAHDALLDPVSKENYEKYGSPDGKQSLEVSIGLPSLILENPKIFLVIYLVCMVAVIPIGVHVWYSRTKLYADRNILLDTYKGFQFLMAKDKKMSKIPEVMAISAEFRKINDVFSCAFFTDVLDFLPPAIATMVNNTKPVLAKLKDKMKTGKLMVQPENLRDMFCDEPKKGQTLSNQVFLGNMLMHSHLNRERLGYDVTEEAMMNDSLDEMLEVAPSILQALIDFCKTAYYTDAVVECIKFSQCMTQAVWTHVGDSAFVQLSPALKKGKGAEALAESCKDLPTLLKMSDEELRRKIAGLSPEVQKDIMQARCVIPNITMTTKVFVVEENDSILQAFHAKEKKKVDKDDDDDNDNDDDDDEGKESSEKASKNEVVVEDASDDEDETRVVNAVAPITGETIFAGDLVKLRVELTRENVPDGGTADFVYCPFFPGAHQEAWWMMLCHPRSGAVLLADRITSQDRVISHDLKFMAPPEAGDNELDLMVMCENYVGLDMKKTVAFHVRPQSEVPVIDVHEEDKNLDLEPTLFDQMMTMNDSDSSDSEDSDED